MAEKAIYTVTDGRAKSGSAEEWMYSTILYCTFSYTSAIKALAEFKNSNLWSLAIKKDSLPVLIRKGERK